MNDEFLYRLRAQPPLQFSVRLKARLDAQAREYAARQRRRRWYGLIAAILTGGAAFAVVTPGVRDWAYALLERNGTTKDAASASAEPPSRTEAPSPGGPESSLNAPAAHSGTSAPKDVSSARSLARAEAVEPAAEARSTNEGNGAPPAVSGVAVQSAQSRALLIARDQLTEGLVDAFTKDAQKALPHVAVSSLTIADGEPLCVSRPRLRNREIDLIVTTGRIPESHLRACQRMGLVYKEIVLAHDAIALIVNRENFWTESITIDELRQIVLRRPYEPLQTWNQIRPEWPTVTFTFVGTASNSASTNALRRLAGEPEPAVSIASEDDAGVVREVESNMGALGYISIRSIPRTHRYPRSVEYTRNVVAIVANEHGPVYPTETDVRAGNYPLARPIYGYIKTSYAPPAARRFAILALENAGAIESSGYVPLSDERLRAVVRELETFRWD